MIQFPFFSSVKPPASSSEPAYWFLFQGNNLLIYSGDDVPSPVPRLRELAELGLTAVFLPHYLGYLQTPDGSAHCYTAELAEDAAPPAGMAFHGLRRLYQQLGDNFFWVAGRAVQIVDWDRTHRFCGRCATPVETLAHERAKKCPACGLTTYPRLAPAIIIAIERPFPDGNRLLLARNARFPSGFYSVLAGFVEPGETLEECAQREVREEVGLEIKNIRYFGSQPWPFPHSLMVGFTAEYASGDIVLEEEELEHADWFAANAMPQTPPSLSISSHLIDWFVNKNGRGVLHTPL